MFFTKLHDYVAFATTYLALTMCQVMCKTFYELRICFYFRPCNKLKWLIGAE